MTAREINLIQTKTQQSPQELLIRSLARIWTPIVAVMYALVLVAVIFFNLQFSQQKSDLQSQILTQQNAIGSLTQIEGSISLLKQKLRVTSDILNNQFPFEDVVTWVSGYRSEQITVRSITVSEDGKLIVETSVADAYVVDSFIRGLLDTTARFKRLQLASLDRLEDGSFRVVLEFIAQGKPEATPEANPT